MTVSDKDTFHLQYVRLTQPSYFPPINLIFTRTFCLTHWTLRTVPMDVAKLRVVLWFRLELQFFFQHKINFRITTNFTCKWSLFKTEFEKLFEWRKILKMSDQDSFLEVDNNVKIEMENIKHFKREKKEIYLTDRDGRDICVWEMLIKTFLNIYTVKS